MSSKHKSYSRCDKYKCKSKSCKCDKHCLDKRYALADHEHPEYDIENQCLTYEGKLEGNVNSESLCFDVECPLDFNLSDFKITREYNDFGILENPINTVEPTDPEFCNIEDPVEQDLASPIPKTQTLNIGFLQFTNESSARGGPLFFREDPSGRSTDQVLVMGCPNNFFYPAFQGPDKPPYPIGNSDTIVNVTIDKTDLDPSISSIAITLEAGYSTEIDYDFFRISIDGGSYLFNSSGSGSTPETAYLPVGPLTVRLPVNSTLTFDFYKDGIWWGGFDNCYFKIIQAAPIPTPSPPTRLLVYRGEEVVDNWDNFDFDLQDSGVLQADKSLLEGDRVCMEYDDAVYNSLSVDFSFKNTSIITKHLEPNQFLDRVDLDEVHIGNVVSADLTRPSGWYASGDPGVASYCYIKELPSGDLLGFYQSAMMSGAYQLNGWFGSATVREPKISSNKYFMLYGNVYDFNPVTGNFDIDMQHPVNQEVINFPGLRIPTQFRRIKNPDNKLWQYRLDLQDETKVFNQPDVYFDYLYEYYKSGHTSGDFTTEGKCSLIEGTISNTKGYDFSEYSRPYGSGKRHEYDELYNRLKNHGIEYNYNVKRLIYWPSPGSADEVSEEKKASLRWKVNQNRYGYLAFVPIVPNEDTDPLAYCKLFRGETVQMSGSDTYLDTIPLRLSHKGFHTGPKPGRNHVQTSKDFDLYNNWSYYSIRLPMKIDETNDTIWTDYIHLDKKNKVVVDKSVPPYPFKLPHGIHYFSDIINMLYQAWLDSGVYAFLDVGNIAFAVLTVLDYTLLFNTGNVYGPNHPDYPSNFFGENGMNIQYMFERYNGEGYTGADGNPYVSNGDVIPANSPSLIPHLADESDGQYFGYQSHTPLTSEEICSLVDNLDNIVISSTHGPIRSDMLYVNYVACVSELQNMQLTEDHNFLTSYWHAADQLDYECVDTVKEVMEFLSKHEPDPFYNYARPGGFNSDYLYFAPDYFVWRSRSISFGHPGEMSEYYQPYGWGANSSLEGIDQSNYALEWRMPRNLAFYPENTDIPGVGDISNRHIAITAINYIDNPRWVITAVAPAGLLGPDVPAGAPTFDFAPYSEGAGSSEIYVDGSPVPMHPKQVPGEWLIGTLKEEKVREILELSPTDEAPVIGYITHDYTAFATDPDSDDTLLPWYDARRYAPSFRKAPAELCMAATVIREFNNLGVKHIVIDQRDTGGGGGGFWDSIIGLCGGARTSAADDTTKIYELDSNGCHELMTARTILQTQLEGSLSDQIDSFDADPDYWISQGLPEDCVWNGERNGTRSRIVWYTNGSTISATQLAYSLAQEYSLDKQNFYGNFGKDTQLIGYGVYTRPFSTGGGYISNINWWTQGRAGTEYCSFPLIWNTDRWEFSREAYYHDVNGDCSRLVYKGLDQEFGQLQRPQIKWDMNADVFFQDIGFVKGNPGINPPTDGEPWLCERYSDVNFSDSLTYRDSVMERTIQMVVDPNLESHIYVNDGYGYVGVDECPP